MRTSNTSGQSQKVKENASFDIFNQLAALLGMVIIASGLLIYVVYQAYFRVDLDQLFIAGQDQLAEYDLAEDKPKKSDFWTAPDAESIPDEDKKALVLYGKDLIAHTAKYLGPNGTVARISNGMNCQNCHLDAGTRVFGNNYGSVASTYPKFRARSGEIEDIYKRVNDCFERSLNGKALDTLSTEMQAIKAYISFLGTNVQKDEKAKGSGLKDIAYLDRAADPVKGQQIYIEKCQLCHQKNGEGTLAAEGKEYIYPPLWGRYAYNDAAGLYRISNFAKYVKYNMPLGATHESPQLTDEEAWDVAAFVNSQPRPHKDVPFDWPDISKKPMDHPFGPFADNFDSKQHKYGPFKPILAELEKNKK
jgi:thiosulfate dehydrogenase